MSAARRNSLQILVVYRQDPGAGIRLGVERHLRALEREEVNVAYVNAAVRPSPDVKRGCYDGIVLHTTFLGLRWSDDFPRIRRQWQWLSGQACPIVALPQDEYAYSEVLDEWLDDLGADAVFSCFDETTRAPIYARTRAAFRLGLTGYLDADTAAHCERNAVPADERPYDVVYRAKRLPFWLGRHGQLKHEIGTATAERAPHHGLRVDISTRPEDTIFGTRWLDFMLSGRAVVGCESGSSVLDRRGEIRRLAGEVLALDPEMPFDDFDRRMPTGWDSWAFYAVSPRHFEAVLTRTCQVLVEGRYSGVLQPNRHYLPVRRDLSDLDEVLERLHDRALLREITECAYEEVYLNGAWTTDDFARELVDSLSTRRADRRHRRPARRTPGPLPASPRRRFRLRRVRLGLVAAHALVVRPHLAASIGRSLLAKPSDVVLAPGFARDLLRLGALDRFEQYQRAHGGPWRVQSAREPDRLLLVSRRDGDPDVNPHGSAGTFAWDHSRYGRVVTLSPGSRNSLDVGIGPDGVWRFDGLSQLAARRPEVDWARTLGVTRAAGDPLPSRRGARRGFRRGPLSRNRNPDSEATK
jgi:hypothetical protein